MSKKILFSVLAIVVVFALGYGAWYLFGQKETDAPKQVSQDETVNGQVITVRGLMTCLPKKNAGEMQTLECAIGLQADDTYYGLSGLTQEDQVLYSTGKIVDVRGSFTKAGDNEKYDIIGTITVETIVSVNEGEPVGTESEMQGYTNNEYNFSLEYSADFKQLSEDDNARLPWSYGSSRAGLRLVTVDLPREIMPKTNFAGASVSVGISRDSAEVGGCIIGDSEPAETKTINKATFVIEKFNDAGAGNFYETTSYRILRDNVCIALEATMHSTNIQNYSPEQGIKEFDKARIQEVLDEVVNSFKFSK